MLIVKTNRTFKKTQKNDVKTLVTKSRSLHRRCSTKKVSLKLLENSQENTCVFFNKVAGSGLQNYI